MFRPVITRLASLVFVLGGGTVSFGNDVPEQVPPHSGPGNAQVLAKTCFTQPPPLDVQNAFPGIVLQNARIFNGRVLNEYDFYRFSLTVDNDPVYFTYKLPGSSSDMVVSFFNGSGALIAYADAPKPGNPTFMTLKHPTVPKGFVYVVVTHKPYYPAALDLPGVMKNPTSDGVLVTGAPNNRTDFVLKGDQPPGALNYTVNISTPPNDVTLLSEQNGQTSILLKAPSRLSNQVLK